MKDEDVDKDFHILPMPPVPPEAWQFIEEAQKANEVASRTIVGSHVKEEHNRHRED